MSRCPLYLAEELVGTFDAVIRTMPEEARKSLELLRETCVELRDSLGKCHEIHSKDEDSSRGVASGIAVLSTQLGKLRCDVDKLTRLLGAPRGLAEPRGRDDEVKVPDAPQFYDGPDWYESAHVSDH